MNEEKAVKLFRGVTGIGDDLIEEARAVQVVKKKPAWRRWGALAACLCLAVLGAGVWRWMAPADAPHSAGGAENAENMESAEDESVGFDSTAGGVEEGERSLSKSAPEECPRAPGDGAGTSGMDNGEADGIQNAVGDRRAGCTLPGGIEPALRVGGTLYHWTGTAQKAKLSYGTYSISGSADTYLPEGYEPCGELAGVTEGEPGRDLQLQAGFEASGTVFASEEYPAVVYVLMTTDWFEDAYVRFASEALGNNELLSWQGRSYRLSVGTGLSEPVKELPEGSELIGTLRFVGGDTIPSGDLETNCRSDTYGRPVEGREVYAVPGDDSVLYVFERQYWREGDYPAWRVCRLWER